MIGKKYNFGATFENGSHQMTFSFKYPKPLKRWDINDWKKLLEAGEKEMKAPAVPVFLVQMGRAK